MPFLRFFGPTPSELPTSFLDTVLYWAMLVAVGILVFTLYRRFMYERDSNTVIRIYTPKLSAMSNISVNISYKPRLSDPPHFTLDMAPPITEKSQETEDEAIATGVCTGHPSDDSGLRQRKTTTTVTAATEPQTIA